MRYHKRSGTKPSTKAPDFFSREWNIQFLGNWLLSAPTSTAFSMTCKINSSVKMITNNRSILPLTFPGFLPHRKWNIHSRGKRLHSASTLTAYWITYTYCPLHIWWRMHVPKNNVSKLLGNTREQETITHLFYALVQSCTVFFGQAGRALQWMNSCLWGNIISLSRKSTIWIAKELQYILLIN